MWRRDLWQHNIENICSLRGQQVENEILTTSQFHFHYLQCLPEISVPRRIWTILRRKILLISFIFNIVAHKPDWQQASQYKIFMDRDPSVERHFPSASLNTLHDAISIARVGGIILHCWCLKQLVKTSWGTIQRLLYVTAATQVSRGKKFSWQLGPLTNKVQSVVQVC